MEKREHHIDRYFTIGLATISVAGMVLTYNIMSAINKNAHNEGEPETGISETGEFESSTENSGWKEPDTQPDLEETEQETRKISFVTSPEIIGEESLVEPDEDVRGKVDIFDSNATSETEASTRRAGSRPYTGPNAEDGNKPASSDEMER